jgi:hypothetical protein
MDEQGFENAYAAIREALAELARKGLIVDTGRRRYSTRSGKWEIVWTKAEYIKGSDYSMNVGHNISGGNETE